MSSIYKQPFNPKVYSFSPPLPSGKEKQVRFNFPAYVWLGDFYRGFPPLHITEHTLNPHLYQSEISDLWYSVDDEMAFQKLYTKELEFTGKIIKREDHIALLEIQRDRTKKASKGRHKRVELNQRIKDCTKRLEIFKKSNPDLRDLSS